MQERLEFRKGQSEEEGVGLLVESCVLISQLKLAPPVTCQQQRIFTRKMLLVLTVDADFAGVRRWLSEASEAGHSWIEDPSGAVLLI